MPASFTTSLPVASTSLKRKLLNDDADHEYGRPSKLPAIAETDAERPIKPLRQNATVTNTNGARKLGVGPPPLTKPRAPALSGPPPTTITTRSTRASSAPPRSSASRSVSRTNTHTRRAGARTASGPQRPTTGAGTDPGFCFQPLQSYPQPSSNARSAEDARLAADMDAERMKVAALQAEQSSLSRSVAAARSQESTQRRELISRTADEIDALRKRHARELIELEEDARRRERELHDATADLATTREDLERERKASAALRDALSQSNTANTSLQAQSSALQSQLDALRAANDGTAETVMTLRLELEAAQRRIGELEEEAHEAEMTRRRLHNMVQELKGNIRVFARVRPLLASDVSSPEDEKVRKETLANMAFPDRDNREIVLSSSSESATGQERKETWNFSFDRVFEPQSTQEEVFEEISMLAQSCADGYNVCIFAYGQTGSGKSFTMEGGPTSENAGMIPRAVDQVFQATEELKSKGWEYILEGQFLEIYNETINDLLGKGEFDKKKHEIKHEKGTTRVTDVVVKPLRSPAEVRALLALANSRRTVAATLMNERSSRSHSVFTLRIRGTNTHTGQACEGALNLVDLAGSERLNASGAGKNKDRLRETQNINKSLSALGDVIAALGEKSDKSDKHIPYRNSKLTYLLQNSLGGNSKALMFLNLSPLAAHLNESLCSLRFATKVNNTHVGTAKKQIKST